MNTVMYDMLLSYFGMAILWIVVVVFQHAYIVVAGSQHSIGITSEQPNFMKLKNELFQTIFLLIYYHFKTNFSQIIQKSKRLITHIQLKISNSKFSFNGFPNRYRAVSKYPPFANNSGTFRMQSHQRVSRSFVNTHTQ